MARTLRSRLAALPKGPARLFSGARMRWLGIQALRVALGAFVFSCLQVLLVRWIDPPLTLTMVERALDYHAEKGKFRWPDYDPLPLDELGPHPARVAVAAEDAWFFHHSGFDLDAIEKAWDYNRKRPEGAPKRGGSTITQQVARNVFLWQGRSYLRKGLEVWYTVLLEVFLPKERILELYVNVAQTGPMCFGFEAGAQTWYKQPAKKLTAEQAARIAALLPSPNHWSPSSKSSAGRAQRILAHRVPFPGEAGFEEMARER